MYFVLGIFFYIMGERSKGVNAFMGGDKFKRVREELEKYDRGGQVSPDTMNKLTPQTKRPNARINNTNNLNTANNGGDKNTDE